MYIPNEILDIIFAYKHQLLLMDIHKELKKKFFECNFCKTQKFEINAFTCPDCFQEKICKQCVYEEEIRVDEYITCDYCSFDYSRDYYDIYFSDNEYSEEEEEYNQYLMCI